jgi:hypothetical protein
MAESGSRLAIRYRCANVAAAKGTIEYMHAVMNFVFFANATENANGLGNAELVYQNLSKSSLQCGVGLNVLPVFRLGCRTDAAQLSAGQ